jgi:hypothetical protein
MFNPEILAHPYNNALRQFMFQILQGSFAEHEGMLERFMGEVKSEKDYAAFTKLFMAVYESAFLKAVEQNREALERIGYRATITAPEKKPEQHDIFNRQN